jgi:hypothetical protein
MGWWLGLAPATLEFWVRFPNERNQGKQAHPVLKYRVPHGSQPRPGWAPDPLMVGIRSPDGLVVGSCTSHPGVLGSIPKREEPGKTGAPCIKVQGSSRVPAPPWVGSRSPDGWDQIPRWAGGWVLHQPPWSFGFDSQTRGTRENRRTCIKVPGSSRVPAPPWVGSRSPDGWDQIPQWAGGWVLHQPPWSFGFDSQTRGTRENRRTLC